MASISNRQDIWKIPLLIESRWGRKVQPVEDLLRGMGLLCGILGFLRMWVCPLHSATQVRYGKTQDQSLILK